ncbi:MAG: LamG-like jellyroll fold domain-containing protein [Armatimonadota bacterium]
MRMHIVTRIVFVLAFLLLGGAMPVRAVVDPDLTGYWTFDEGQGTVIADWSGKQAGTGDILGASWDANGRIGKCLYFDGVDDLVEIADGPWNTGSPLTIMAWYKRDGTAINGTVFEHEFSALPGAYRLCPAQVMFSAYDGNQIGYNVNDSTIVPSGVWVQAAVTISNTEIRVYKNGVQVGATTAITGGFPVLKGRLALGAQAAGPSTFMKGWIDELATFKRVLTGTEIATIYQNYQNGLALETPYTGVAVGAVTTDKILYRRGESGQATVSLKNFATTTQNFTLTLESVTWLQTTRTLAQNNYQLTADQGMSVTIPFTLSSSAEEFGCEIRATVGTSKCSRIVNVTDNLWQVGICGTVPPSSLYNYSDTYIASLLRQRRREYANWFELFFWAPDDWGNLNPTPAEWYSGQVGYHMSKAKMQTFINQAHAYGAKVITYGKGIGGGPDAWETTRRHPEWILKTRQGSPQGSWNVYDLDNWNNTALRQSGWTPLSVWYRNFPDFRKIPPLDWGLDQIIRSNKTFGWDGIRYDGHYTMGSDALSTWNMRHLKETVWAASPNYVFGFNYGYGPDGCGQGITHEMREGMAGGGLWLEEAIGAWAKNGSEAYTTWTDYAEHELANAKQVQAVGGSYHCAWQLTNSATGMYKLIYGLIAGGHSTYGSHVNAPGCGNWGKFMTRWSAFLWDHHITQVENSASVCMVSAPSLYWQPFMQQVIASSTKRYTIVHLVNPSTSDVIANTALPSPVNNVAVDYLIPANTTITRAVLIRPESEPYDLVLPVTEVSGYAHVTVPQVNYWGMVVYEETSTFTMPTTPPTYTEPPNPVEVAAGRATSGSATEDPLSPPANITLAPNEMLWETDCGYNSLPAIGTTDADANNGLAQIRPRGTSATVCIGRTWIGGFPPGRYRARLRIKLVDDDATINRQYCTITYYRFVGEQLVYHGYLPTLDTAVGTPIERKLVVDGQYHDYTLPEMDFHERSIIHLAGSPASPDDPADNCLYCDHIIVEQLEQYTDTQLAAWNTVTKPGGLRTPNGSAPQNILLVKGMHWQPYNIEGAVTCTSTYTLPENYTDIYTNDAIVLCDVDFSNVAYDTRKMLKDFVEDGGRLVFLGGLFTLGNGGMKGTYLEDISPFTLAGPDEVVQCAPASVLGPTTTRAYADTPQLFWRHNVTLRNDASVLAYAGTTPIAAKRNIGKGSVYVFAGTVAGDTASTNVYYDVGPGQTYATIQAALNATPFTFDSGQPTGTVPDPFTQNHIIRVHAGTYAAFNTDYFSKLSGKASRTSPQYRLIIEAVPGELVTVNTTSTSNIRESYVTIQGLKFTGSTGVNSYYLTLNPYNDGRCAVLVYNNEFVGAPALKIANPPPTSTQFTYAFVHNYVHHFNANYVVLPASADTGKGLMAGNLIAYPLSYAGGNAAITLNAPTGAASRYVLNNTYYVGGNVANIPMIMSAGVDQSMVTIANNLLVQETNGTYYDFGYYLLSGGGAGVYITHFPLLLNNLQYDNGVAANRWTRVSENGGTYDFTSLTAFNNYTNAVGATPGEQNSIDNTNPLLVNPAGNNFRLQGTSPARNAGDVARWNTAISDFGIAELLSVYLNPAVDPGFDRGHNNIGAMQ